MAMGRGKGNKIVALAMLLLVCLYRVDAETHVVGESQGWGLSVSYDSWTNGKTFTAGDTLGLSLSISFHSNIHLISICKKLKLQTIHTSIGTD